MSIVGELPVTIKWTWEYDPIKLAYTVYLLFMVEWFMSIIREG